MSAVSVPDIPPEPSREGRLRRLAHKKGYGLARRAKKPGFYWIFDRKKNRLIGGQSGLTLDEVEDWLTADRP